MAKRDPVNLVKGVVKVASLPSIYLKVEEAVNSVNTSNQAIADIVSEDTALAAKLLRLANSAMYNFPSKIDTVSQAITIIGTRQLRDLVLACSVVSVFKDMPADLVDMESFWRHSIACAVSARLLSGYRRDANIESAFVAGLLHDIGRLILYKEMPDSMTECIDQAQTNVENLVVAEKRVLGFDHAMVGGLLLKEWKLPPRLVETTTRHHMPARSVTYPAESATIHIADLICASLRMGTSGERRIPKLDGRGWENLGLSVDVLDTLVDELQTQYSSAVDFVLGQAA